MEYIKVPLSVIGNYKRESIFWVLCVIVAGQFGILCNWFVQTVFTKKSFMNTFISDFNNGNFYIFTISLMASSFFIILISFLYDEKSHFKSLKIFTLFILGFGILWCGSIHSLVQAKPSYFYGESFFKYYLQIVGYLTGVFASVYAACIVKLDYDNERHKKLDDKSFHATTDTSVKEMDAKSKDTTKDRKGRSL
ncbi:hypothetical protein [Acinetobacter celticus]|uniref:Uncharacterized protein n=1 Tax=Acinetobacter celticus TaxID=1891224 RepID=A0A1C3CY31_9GAMM|nr:hypothetical protein [Acinetobacter celticus]ODA13716.1 hypothetical protein BBP83_04905 [Acinetobacter celticus]